MKLNAKTVFLLYLGALSLVGMCVIYLATSRMGPGVSTDSAMILSTGENLFRGRGLVDYTGAELTQFPPLYSLIMGLGSFISGADIFVVGWALNVLVFGALVWFSGMYLYHAIPNEPILAYFGSFVVLSSSSLIEISSNIASDPLFMLMLIFFLILSAAYLRTGQTRYMALAGALTIVACFERYAALALVIAGTLVAVYGNRPHWRRALLAGLLFGALTAAPIVAWGYVHNAPVNDTVFGARLPSVPALNFSTGAAKVLYWFIPYRIIAAVGPVYLTGIVLVLCVLVVLVTGSRRFMQTLSHPALVPNIAFLFVYFSVLVFDISYYELKGIETDRVHIVALTSVLVLMAAIGSQLLTSLRGRLGSRWTYGLAILLFVAWSSYPITRASEYVRSSMLRGDISPYNSINKGNIQRSDLAVYLHSLDLEGKAVYSNGCDTAWFILRREVKRLPTLRSADRAAELEERFAGWPGPGSRAYVVWINAESHKTNYATPDELASIADLTQLYTDQDASVYRARAR
ncbi:MAG: hypothetical protein ACK2T0_15825 [Anaerolineales bacterium]